MAEGLARDTFFGMRLRWPSLFLCSTTTAVIATLAVVHGDLPDRVPTHFDAAGRADGWSTRTGFVVAMGALSLFLAALFAGIGALVARLPTSLVNLPHREHWLAPERRAASLAAVAGHMQVFGAACQVLVLGIVLYCVRASRSEAPQTGPDFAMWAMLGGYFAFVVGWLVALHRRFHRPR